MIGYLGVDWASKRFDSSIAVGNEEPRPFKSAGRTAKGARLVVDAALAVDGVTEVHVIIEAGAPGWVELFHEAGAKVFEVDGSQAKAFAGSLRSSGAKSDGGDAVVQVLMGQSPVHATKQWTPQEPTATALDELVAILISTTQERTRAVQALRSYLRERVPTLEGLLKDLHRPWVTRLLREVPTAWHACHLDRRRFDEVLAGSGTRFKTREQVWEALQLEGRRPEHKIVAQARATRIHVMLDRIETLTASIETLEKKLNALTADLDLKQVLTSVDGIGDRLSVQLMSLGFQLSGPPKHRDEVSIKMGASPVFVGSGELKGQPGKKKGRAKMRRAANSRARRTTYLLGRLASQQLDWAAAMYRDGRARGQNAATVYRRISRSLLRILTAMVRTNTPYDNDRYVRALQANGVRWAAGLSPAAPTDA